MTSRHFSWGDCMPAGDLTDGTPNRPIDLGKTGFVHHECEIGHRASSALAGAGSISTAEIEARLAAMFGDDNADTPSLSVPAPRAASELSPTTSRSAPAATFCPPEKDLSREPQCRPAATCPRRRNRGHRRPGSVAPRCGPRPARGVPRRRLIKRSRSPAHRGPRRTYV